MKKLPSLVLKFGAAAILLTGCTVFPKTSRLHNIRTSSSQENADTFVSVDNLALRLATLKKGMSESAVYDSLGVSPKRFSTVSDDQKMRYVDGPQIPQPRTAEEQDKIKARADSYTVRELSYRSVNSRSGLGLLLTTEKQTTGFDLRLQLTFKDGLFDKVSLAGVQEINRYSKETIIAVLGSAVRGGGADVLQRIIRDAIKTPAL